MAGLDHNPPVPTEIKLHQLSRKMEITFADGLHTELSFEFLRVHSPSAEVRGHGPGQETLQTGKREVEVSSVDAVGNYAIRPNFSDGHNTGIYSWDYLYHLARDHDALWARYLARLEEAGASREPRANPAPPPRKGCGHG